MQRKPDSAFGTLKCIPKSKHNKQTKYETTKQHYTYQKSKTPNIQTSKIQKVQKSKNIQESKNQKIQINFGLLDFSIFGILDFWSLGPLAFSVLLFVTKAASENQPKCDQQKSRLRTVFFCVLKGSACRRGGADHMYICLSMYYLR